MPLWRSLILNLADRFSPERLPPLQLTSRPVNTGMMFGDRLALPWYRTVFSNLADVMSPDLGPPLELTSQPVEVGELLGDDLDHGWWTSLLDGLRYRLSPEKEPPLSLSAKPIVAYGANSWLQLMDWSSLLEGPKRYPPSSRIDAQFSAAEALAPAPAITPITAAPASAAAAMPSTQELWAAQMQFKRDISRSRFRQKIWMSLVAAEVVLLLAPLLAYFFNFKL